MKSLEELRKLRKESLDQVDMRRSGKGTRIVVGMATCGISAGARTVMMSLVEEVKRRNLQDVTVTQTGCIGACRLEPMFEVYKQGEEKVTYVHMDGEKAKKVIADHVVNGKVIQEYTIGAYEK